MKPVIILHHHEIVLKGENRPLFERQLLRNVRTAIADLLPGSSVGGGYGRFVLALPESVNLDQLVERLSRVFGLANICTGVQTEQSLEEFCRSARSLLEGREFKTIRVETRRPDKRFSPGSMEVNARVGEFLCRTFGVRADLTRPDETVHIEIADGTAFVYRSRVAGAGGLPTGISGRVVALLSAGFDSPVAAYRIMKRGAEALFVHFHSMPYTSQRSVDQVRQLAEVLTRHQFRSTLYLVPFADVQNEIVLHAPQQLRVILYRRMMIRIAEALGSRAGVEGLVTGEALGQVASQTLRNIRVIDEAASLPILRPLSGSDKEETMAMARQIGTYDISREPYDDCCSFLAPRKPATWADPAEVSSAESELDVHSLVDRAVRNAAREEMAFPPVHAPGAVPDLVP